MTVETPAPRVPFTIYGASGFIGGEVARYLQSLGHPVRSVGRDDPFVEPVSLGHVVYAIGLTADFRSRPLDTMDAHVGVLTELLRDGRFSSFTYLSTTRLYSGAATGEEDAIFAVDPQDPDDLYNLSKLAGEAACLSCESDTVRIARLSNIVGFDSGSENFLSVLMRDATMHGDVRLRTAPESQKDFLGIDDAVAALREIAINGQHRIYNVAAGCNITNRDIAHHIERLTDARVSFAPEAPTVSFPGISTRRLTELFSQTGNSWNPVDLPTLLEKLAQPQNGAARAAIGGTR